MTRDDWLNVPAAPREVLGAETPGEPPPSGGRTFDLLAPEHRDKLVALLRLAHEGRRWEDVRDDVLSLFDLDGR